MTSPKLHGLTDDPRKVFTLCVGALALIVNAILFLCRRSLVRLVRGR